MKSSIKIDFNDSLEPVIEVNKILSEDTRDRLVAAWVERLGYISNIALVEFKDSSQGSQKIQIRAMGTKKDLEFMKDLIQSQLDSIPEPTDIDILTT